MLISPHHPNFTRPLIRPTSDRSGEHPSAAAGAAQRRLNPGHSPPRPRAPVKEKAAAGLWRFTDARRVAQRRPARSLFVGPPGALGVMEPPRPARRASG